MLCDSTQHVETDTYMTCFMKEHSMHVQVPTGVAVFPKEICCMPKNWAEGFYNIQQWTVMEKGGHFAAKEEPEDLANDVQNFFKNEALFGKDFAQ